MENTSREAAVYEFHILYSNGRHYSFCMYVTMYIWFWALVMNVSRILKLMMYNANAILSVTAAWCQKLINDSWCHTKTRPTISTSPDDISWMLDGLLKQQRHSQTSRQNCVCALRVSRVDNNNDRTSAIIYDNSISESDSRRRLSAHLAEPVAAVGRSMTIVHRQSALLRRTMRRTGTYNVF